MELKMSATDYNPPKNPTLINTLAEDMRVVSKIYFLPVSFVFKTLRLATQLAHTSMKQELARQRHGKSK
jgi:hypothetical protein